MNNMITAADLWFAKMDIATFSEPSGLRVRKSDISTWGTTDEILADLKEYITANGMNGKKLAWNNAEESMDWMVLYSF